MTQTACNSSPKPNGQAPTAISEDLVSPLLRTAKNEARTLADTLKGEALRALRSRQQSASATLEDVAGTLKQSHGDADDASQAIRETAADYVSASAEKLRDIDPEEALENLTETARRHPVPLVIGAAALGFLAARFLTSSEQ